jgi:hypothetical protein
VSRASLARRGVGAAVVLAALLGSAPLASRAAEPDASRADALGPNAPGPTTRPTVKPTAPAATPSAPAEDIREIRGPKAVANPWLVPALVGGVVLLALLAYGVWRWRRRRQKPRVLLPFEVALQKLEAIRTLMQPQQAREFSIAATDIIRTYIEQRFDVTATHRTTEEFLHDLLTSSNAALARHRGLLETFLNECDLVKFAGVSLSLADMESLHRSACDFVRQTAAPDPPVTAPGSKAAAPMANA